MKTGSCGSRRSLLRYSGGAFILVVLVLLFSRTFEPTDSLRKGHDVGVSTDTLSSTSSDGGTASYSGALHEAKESEKELATDSNDTSAVEASAAVPSPQFPVTNKPQLDVVIAHHSEEPYYIRVWTDSLRSLPFVQELGMRIIIYTKGAMELAAIKEASGADEVVQLPNVGREGGTYLHHLLRVYDGPPRFTLLAQAKLRKAQEEGSGKMTQWLQDRLRTKFNDKIGFMSMDRKHDVCYCGHCTDMGRDDFYPLWAQLYSMLQGRVCQQLEGHVLSFNGHFIVSRKRVLARSRDTYQYLQALVDAPADHWIHSEPEPKWFDKDMGKSQPSNPKFGHTLERLWHTIFSCDDPTKVVDCDMDGMRAEGPGGCSCLDDS